MSPIGTFRTSWRVAELVALGGQSRHGRARSKTSVLTLLCDGPGYPAAMHNAARPTVWRTLAATSSYATVLAGFTARKR
jgi:hypothetical protein